MAGSSPLTRGKRYYGFLCCQTTRLIPAHAGKTIDKARAITANRAHPRSRGENHLYYVNGSDLSGSSPLTRGKPWPVPKTAMFVRLIPAHAGKTTDRRRECRRSRAHPRSRGENRAEIADLQTRAGSSPLTRGKRVTGCNKPVTRGLIPAHAGKTRRGPSARR